MRVAIDCLWKYIGLNNHDESQLRLDIYETDKPNTELNVQTFSYELNK